jgi:uncharacterized heparinase superfamily protein
MRLPAQSQIAAREAVLRSQVKAQVKVMQYRCMRSTRKQPELLLTRPTDGRSADDLNVGDNVLHLNHNIAPSGR